MSAEREEQFLGEIFGDHGGIDPARLGPVVDLIALGLVNGAWRNTYVENWHATGRLHDGDMLRVNNHLASSPTPPQLDERERASLPTGRCPRWTISGSRMLTALQSELSVVRPS
jgi:hypothetical protein